jgi:O-antigen/teichoic acid export membrane protein
MSSDIRSRTITGLGWSGFAHSIRQFLMIATQVVLARVLGPDAFGLMAMIIIFTGFAQLFGDMGLGPALVQKADLEARHINAIFWANVTAGATLTLIGIAVAPLVAIFYDQPILQWLMIVLSFDFLIMSFKVVQDARLQRAMDFHKLAIVDISATLLAGIVAIAMALSGLGVWSLVAQVMLTTAATVGLLWLLSPWRPAFAFDRSALGELLGFSGNLLGFNVFNYWVRNIDDLLVGKVLGAGALGFYTLAYRWMLLPVSQVSLIITRVMFPVLSQMQHDRAAVRHVYLYATRLIALVAFPLMAGLLVVTEPFILTLYGEDWAPAVPVLQVLCLQGITQSVGTTVGWIYTSQGRTDLMFRWGMFSGVVLLSAFVIGLNWGILGVAVAYVVAGYTMLWYPSWKIPGRLIGLSFGDMLRNLASVFGCTLGMAAVVWAVGRLLPAGWSPWAYLAIQIPSGVLAYVLLIHSFRIRPYREVSALAGEQFQKLPFWKLRPHASKM